jgi:hypothetical protein
MAGAGLPQQNTQQTAPQSKGPASTAGQPTYQPIGVNNPPASYNPVAPVPNDQSPYKMNEVTDGNMQQNQNTKNTNDYSPMLPDNILTQGQPKQWYPGMYPSSQPQFGSNPYSPQTFNIQGHPGQNPTRIANIEPNQPNDAYSNEGQFQQVKTMAGGGLGSGKGSIMDAITRATNNFAYTHPPAPGAFGKGAVPQDASQQAIPVAHPVAITSPSDMPVYRPQYTQPVATASNIDSYGNTLYNSGGLASIPRK